MDNFRKVQDGRGWLANQEVFDLNATKVRVGIVVVLFGLDYDLPSEGAQISKVNEEHSVEEGYFYVVALDCELRFPLEFHSQYVE